MLQFMLSPREGKSVRLGGLGVDFKIAGEQTGGLFSIVEHPIDPGVLVPPHTHTREDEFSYLLTHKRLAHGEHRSVHSGSGVPHGPSSARAAVLSSSTLEAA